MSSHESTGKKQKVAEQRALLASLPQTLAAEISGQPTVWFRDNAHRLTRNEDGSYDAAALVTALRTDFQPAELPDHLLEVLLQLQEELPSDLEGRRKGTIRALEEIEVSHGPAGMAAIGYALLEGLREYQQKFPDLDAPRITEEDIKREAARRIRELSGLAAKQDRRLVIRCRLCQRYRWGREWKSGSAPHGFVDDLTTCPKCEKRHG